MYLFRLFNKSQSFTSVCDSRSFYRIWLLLVLKSVVSNWIVYKICMNVASCYISEFYGLHFWSPDSASENNHFNDFTEQVVKLMEVKLPYFISMFRFWSDLPPYSFDRLVFSDVNFRPNILSSSQDCEMTNTVGFVEWGWSIKHVVPNKMSIKTCLINIKKRSAVLNDHCQNHNRFRSIDTTFSAITVNIELFISIAELAVFTHWVGRKFYYAFIF